MNFDQRYIALMQSILPRLVQGQARVDNLTRRPDANLGESARREFLAMATLDADVDIISHDEVKARFDRIIGNARVLHRTKRLVIVQLADLPCVINRFGVATFTIPKSQFGDGWASLKSVPVFGSDLLDSVGANHDGRDGRDSLYNYSAREISEVEA